MVRIVRVLTILDFFLSPFFQLNRYLSGYRAIREITAHRRGDTKKNGENLLCFDDFKFFYSPFFQKNFYFWGYRAIRDITAHSWSFAQPPPPSAPVYYNKEATQNKWCETFFVLTILHIFHSPFFQLNCYFCAIT